MIPISARRYAAVAITKNGVRHGEILLKQSPVPLDLFFPDKFTDSVTLQPGMHVFSGSVRGPLPDLFKSYQGLVLFVSLGAVVRLIAPLLKDKKEDPGIVVVDDQANHAITVLSGHLGGGNELARWVAQALGARPVITTASDVNHTVAVDLLGQDYAFDIDNFSKVTEVSAAVVNEESILLWQESGPTDWWKPQQLPSNFFACHTAELAAQRSFAAALVVTHRQLSQEDRTRYLSRGVLYRPKVLHVGVGCNRGTSSQEILDAIVSVFNEYALSLKSIKELASIDVKRDEIGLNDLAQGQQWPIRYFSRDDLNAISVPNPSETVKKFVGVPGVSEAASLLASNHGPLLVPKQKRGNVTIAVAQSLYPLRWNESR